MTPTPVDADIELHDRPTAGNVTLMFAKAHDAHWSEDEKTEAIAHFIHCCGNVEMLTEGLSRRQCKILAAALREGALLVGGNTACHMLAYATFCETASNDGTRATANSGAAW